MSFCVNGQSVALCNNDRIVVYNLEGKNTKTIYLPELKVEKKIDHHNNTDIESIHVLTTAQFSDDGKYLVVCTNRKQLCLYGTKNFELLANRTLARAASRVRFTPRNDIIVADKTGDAYLFSTENPSRTGELLLGHLSMLLDVLVTSNEKCIITTDRDEKIRISMYPNSYNIVSYCLGHAKFVTNVIELPHDKSVLISGSGDGTIKLWNYLNGQELLSVDFGKYLSKTDIERFDSRLQDCHLEEPVTIIPVKHLNVLNLDSESLIILSFYSTCMLVSFKIVGNREKGLAASFVQSFNVDSEPIECVICKRNLWVLMDSGFAIFAYEDNSFNSNHAFDTDIKSLNSLWSTLQVNTHKQDLFPILYKRKYDNVQEYLERKKMRLGQIVE